MDLFQNSGQVIGDIRFLSPGESFQLSDKEVVFIDLRPDFEAVAKQIIVKYLVCIPRKTLAQDYTMLDPEKHFIVFDQVGLHTREACHFLSMHGFTRLAAMAGGIVDWERDGLPITIDPGELLTGSCMCTLKPKKRFKK